MLEERLRLVYISKNGSGFKQISLSGKKFLLVSVLSFLVFGSLIALSIGVFTHLYHNYRIVSLENDREQLQQQLLVFKEKISNIGSELSQIESSGDELRNIANLPPIDSDTRMVGVGGPTSSISSVSYNLDEVSMTANEIRMDLDRFERAVRLEKSSISEIKAKLKEDLRRNGCFPSIRPILGGSITDDFGSRRDPLTHKMEIHRGIDIPAREGTHILSTGDGVVVRVKRVYTPHKSFGKYVIIDHGYGYETLYAHCSKILVKRGQRVTRWQPIAEVGQTGKTTGNHLHYEVHYETRPVDPEYYIYN